VIKKRKSEFGSSFQRHVVACFVRLPDFAVRFRALITEDVIDDPDLGDVVLAARKVMEDSNGVLPSKATLEQEVPKLRSLVRDLFAEDIKDREYVAGKVAKYCQQKACERAVYEVAKAIKDGKKDGIVTILQEALQVGLDISNIGEYLRDYKQRVPEYLHPELRTLQPTGLTHLDLIMGGGLAPGELGIIAASAKAGKSVFLANVAFNTAGGLMNKKAIYYSLEMVQRKVLRRLDTLTAGSVSDKMKTDPRKFTEALKDRMGKLIGGNVLVKSWPTRCCNYSMMSAHLSRAIALGFKPDVVLVDYGDIMKPERRLGETRHEIAGCFEDLRKMAGEFNVPVWSATQLNRGAMNKATPDMADMAESYEKVQIADAIIGIGRTPEEAQNKTCRFIAMGLRDEKSNLIINVHDDRSRMLMKTLEVVTPSAKKDTKSPEGKQAQRREDAKKRMKEAAGEEHES
jgi:replicative DNA helicase